MDNLLGLGAKYVCEIQDDIQNGRQNINFLIKCRFY